MGYSIKLISKDGDFLSLAYRMALAGHDVVAYLENGSTMYDGILQKVHDINELDIQKDDMVIFDMVGGGTGADKLKDQGIHVVGAGAFNDDLELLRRFGMEFMEDHGILVPPSQPVYTLEQAQEIVNESSKRYVFKPDGNQSTDLTYVSSGPENMLAMLPYLFSKLDEGTLVVLQEFIDGIEMSTEAWFNGEEFMMPLNSTMEEKKFMTGDHGPNTGCAGNIVWWWDEATSRKLHDLLFKSMVNELHEARYVGPLDINCIWTPQGPYGLEFTTRFGYDAIQASSRLIDMELGEFLYKMRETNVIPVTSEKYAMAVRVSVPPYPNDGDVPGVPIFVPEDIEDNVYLSDVYVDGPAIADEVSEYRCAGTDGYVLCVADTGTQLTRLQERVYSLIDSLEIPSKQYRIDVGNRVTGDRQALTLSV